jgi:aminoglycoside 2'-N-acetyltransferase I
MNDVRVAHTALLTDGELRAIRVMLDAAFAGGAEGGFTDADWDHTVGGMHATVWEAGEPIAHAAVVQRRLLHGGRALRTGYVEGVAVRADRRRRGHGRAVMAALTPIIQRAYELGALATADGAEPFYAALGWQPWQGPTSALTPAGSRRTPDEDGWIHILPVPGTPLDPTGELTCDWRDGDVW